MVRPISGSVAGLSDTGDASTFSHDVTGSNDSGLDDSGVDPAEMQIFQLGRVHDRSRIRAEPFDELAATGVWRRRHFDESRSYRQPRPDWKVPVAQVQIDVELIPGEGPPLPVLSDQGDDAGVHDVQLAIGMRRPSAPLP